VALQLFSFRDRPNDFAATKSGLPLEQCVFLLDFSRPLQRLRWFGTTNKWIGPTYGLLVPVVHVSEQAGTFCFGVSSGEPYFADIPRLWKRHAGTRRTIYDPPTEGFELIADFATHFAADCQPVRATS